MTKKETTFLNVLKFIHQLQKVKLSINKKKFENVLNTTSFQNMKKLEADKGFVEASTNEETGKKIPFFHLGDKRDWKNILDLELKKKIENNFKIEMVELGYL